MDKIKQELAKQDREYTAMLKEHLNYFSKLYVKNINNSLGDKLHETIKGIENELAGKPKERKTSIKWAGRGLKK